MEQLLTSTIKRKFPKATDFWLEIALAYVKYIGEANLSKIVVVDDKVIFTNPVVKVQHNVKYRVVPTSPEFAVSKDGIAINTLDGEIRPICKTGSHGYYTVRSKIGLNKFRNVLVHRLVADAWLRPNKDPSRRNVNHKDGIKTNNSVFNLEWATYSENSDHAYKTGLREDVHRVTLVELNGPGVYDFTSQAKAAEFLGISPGTLSAKLSSDPDNPYYRGYRIEIKDIEGRLLSIGEKRAAPRLPVFIKGLGSKLLKVKSVREAERITGVNAKRISRCLTDDSEFNGLKFSYKSA